MSHQITRFPGHQEKAAVCSLTGFSLSVPCQAPPHPTLVQGLSCRETLEGPWASGFHKMLARSYSWNNFIIWHFDEKQFGHGFVFIHLSILIVIFPKQIPVEWFPTWKSDFKVTTAPLLSSAGHWREPRDLGPVPPLLASEAWPSCTTAQLGDMLGYFILLSSFLLSCDLPLWQCSSNPGIFGFCGICIPYGLWLKFFFKWNYIFV